MELVAAVNHQILWMRWVSIWQKPDTVDLIGQRATKPGQRCGIISMCAATSEDDVVSFNNEHLMAFLNELEHACQGEDVMLLCGTMSDNAQLVRKGFRHILSS